MREQVIWFVAVVSPSVRQACLDDLETVALILSEAANWQEAQGAPLWSAEDVAPEAMKGKVAAGLYWLAFVGDEAVGCVLYQLEDPLFWPDAELGEAAYLHRLAVRRAHAGGGVSKALLDWAKSRARERGHDFLRLDCDAGREKLRAFFEAHGFVPVGERKLGRYTAVLYEFDLTA